MTRNYVTFSFLILLFAQFIGPIKEGEWSKDEVDWIRSIFDEFPFSCVFFRELCAGFREAFGRNIFFTLLAHCLSWSPLFASGDRENYSNDFVFCCGETWQSFGFPKNFTISLISKPLLHAEKIGKRPQRISSGQTKHEFLGKRKFVFVRFRGKFDFPHEFFSGAIAARKFQFWLNL